jgi:hypothetical protein
MKTKLACATAEEEEIEKYVKDTNKHIKEANRQTKN